LCGGAQDNRLPAANHPERRACWKPSRPNDDSEEQQKKKIANDLHEGLAQTLSAVKMMWKAARRRFDASKTDAFSMDTVIHVLKGAIQEVRSIATNLRPSSLDDLGLLRRSTVLPRIPNWTHPGTGSNGNRPAGKRGAGTAQDCHLPGHRICVKNIEHHRSRSGPG